MYTFKKSLTNENMLLIIYLNFIIKKIFSLTYIPLKAI